MSAAVICTSCNRPLRVPESVLGQLVQCPLCLDEFVAQAGAAAEAAARAAEPPRRAAPARPQPTAAAVQAELNDGEQIPLAPIIPDEPRALPPILEAVPEPPALAPAAPQRGVVFPVMVTRDPDRILRGPMDAELTAEGLYLRKIRLPPAFAAVGTRARYLGSNRLIVTVEGREIELAVNKRRASNYHLARDMAEFLNRKAPLPESRAYALPWYLYAIPPLFIALPFAACPFGLITDGCLGAFLWTAIALGLGVLAIIASVQSWLRPRARVITALSVLGFGAVLPLLTIPFTPKYTVDPNLWTSFTSSSGDFTVDMPGTPSFQPLSVVGGNRSAKKYIVAVNNPDVEFAVYVLTPPQVNNFGPSLADQAVNDVQNMLKGEFSLYNFYWPSMPRSGVVHSQQYREFFYQIPNTSYSGGLHPGQGLATRVYILKDKVVALTAVGPRVKLDGADVVKFFNSIQFTAKPSSPHQLASPITLPGLMLYWSFDQAGNANRPEVANAGGATGRLYQSESVRDGASGAAVHFNGFGSYFDFSDAPNLNFNAGDEFTFSGWLRTRDTTGTVLSARNTADPGAMLELKVLNGQLGAYVRQDNSPNAMILFLQSFVTVNDGKWHHFGLVRRNKGFGCQLGLYIDGELQGAEQQGQASDGAITTNQRALGATLGWNKQPLNDAKLTFTGDIDEFCVFSRALTPDELRQLAGAAGR
ncbi:MAG TPA: LamG-like jellyroll fold domain-containing protein [Gemmataceae bacterium]|nr:LamG-like jellyroll fold domain-containing protein [Gemmataceae bacterium]